MWSSSQILRRLNRHQSLCAAGDRGAGWGEWGGKEEAGIREGVGEVGEEGGWRQGGLEHI